MGDLLDQLVPDSFAQDDVQDRFVGTSKADDGVGVEEGEQLLHHLRASPELLLSRKQDLTPRIRHIRSSLSLKGLKSRAGVL